MTGYQKIAIAQILQAAVNARTTFDTERETELGESMKKYGQHQHILVKKQEDKYILIDGERRWRAAQLVGITELDALVLENPTEEQILIAQMNIDVHRVGLSAMERSDHLERIRDKMNWGVTDTSKQMHIPQPTVTKLLSYQKLCPEARRALHEGRICMERAFIISGIDDPAKQLELLAETPHLTRDQLRRRAHSGGEVELKTHKATFEIRGGLAVVVQGPRMGLTEIIDVLQSVIKELRQAQRDHLDVVTASRVLADKAKVAK